MKIYIVRHGQTNTNAGNRLLGVTDEGINKTGETQCLNLQENIAKLNIDICFSSPLSRTIQTAEIITNKKVPIITDNRLVERNFGTLEGGSSNDKYIPEFWNYYLNINEYGVEPLQELFARTEDFINYLKENYHDKNVLITSHAATIRALHFNLIGFNEDTNMLSFKVDNAKILEYEI